MCYYANTYVYCSDLIDTRLVLNTKETRWQLTCQEET